MPEFNHELMHQSAFDVLAYALQLRKHPDLDNIYTDNNNQLYRRTRWGFEKAERFNLRLALERKERQYERLQSSYYDLQDEYEHVLRRRSGLLQHLESSDEKLKQGKKERGFLKKYLKEVLDKNLSLDKRMERMENQEANVLQQLEKLKKTRDNLLENNLHLSDKTRQQKNQINALLQTIAELKQTLKQVNTDSPVTPQKV